MMTPPGYTGYTHIVHISDIHIRTGDKHKCRYDEYMFVFAELAKQIRRWQSEGKHICVVVTGDVFHHKSKIESAGIVIFHEFLGLLNQLADTILICGNHDFLQENIEEGAIDMIQAMLHNRNLSNVTYLRKSGVHKINNILFGLVAIQDVLQQGAASATIQNAVLPSFPKPSSTDLDSEFDISVALFHGMLNGCSLQNYTTSPTGVPCEWFDGYDIVLLGDIHLRQTKKNWGYAGSLIQQNFGEAPFSHGGLLWDVRTKVATPFNIRSNIAYITIRSLQDARTYFENPLCPQHLKVRQQAEIGSSSVQALAETYGKTIDIATAVTFNAVEAVDNDKVDRQTDSGVFDGINAFEEYINHAITPVDLASTVRHWVNNPKDLCVPICDTLPSHLHQSVQQRNKKIDDQCLEYSDEISNCLMRGSSSLALDSLEWDWILCFKSGNRFNFNATNGNLVAMNARNGQGKSSFIDIVCIALFGTSIHHLRSFASSIICMQTPNKATAKTIIRFRMPKHGNEHTCYELTRTFSRVANAPKRLVSKAVLKADGKAMHSGKTAVDKWIETNVGSIESFVFSSILTQQCAESFFNMDNNQQVNLLDRCFNTNLQNKLNDIFRASLLAHTHVVDTLDMLIRNEMSTKHDLQQKRPLDETNILEYERLQQTARELVSGMQQLPNHAPPPLSLHCLEREMAQLLEIESHEAECIDMTNKIESLLNRVGKKTRDEEHAELRLSNLTKMETELDEIEQNIERLKGRTPAVPGDHILNPHLELKNAHSTILLKYGSVSALEIRVNASPFRQQVDVSILPVATLDDMRRAMTESISSIPSGLQHFVSSLKEPTIDELRMHMSDHDDSSEPHNSDCWACNKRRSTKSKDFQSILSLIRNCRHTFEFLKQQESLCEYRHEKELLLKYNSSKVAVEYHVWENKLADMEKEKEALERCIHSVCTMLSARQEKIRELKYWICIKKMEEAERCYKGSCGNQIMLEKCIIALDNLGTVATALKERMRVIEKAHGAIGGYRVWLFKSRIIPQLSNQVNKFMKMVTTTDHPLQLDASVQCDGNKLTVDWFVQNGPQRPPIEKASGFQKFIASLAIRIVLTQQLGSGTKCSHLFLDEGFVACDAAHLSKVPAFLSNLLFLYNSVIVCTHLEELKDAMDMHVFIQRDAETQLSLINYPKQPTELSST
jgi:DNA repair exonuclease SbcCD nuclease subunit